MPRSLLAVFAVLALLPIAPAVISGRTPLALDHLAGGPPAYNAYQNDVAMQILPWAKAVRVAYKAGELPLRDRWNGCGMALAANSQSAAFSPFTLVALLIPLAFAVPALAATKLLIAMCGMFLWARELRASRWSAAFAGTAFGFSFSMVAWIFFPLTAVLCFWPWIFFLIERCAAARHRLRPALALTLVLCASLLAGHPENLALGVVFAVLWLGARSFAGDVPRPAVRIVVRASVAAAGLTAFLILPSAAAIAASHRLVVVDRPFWHPILSLLPHGPRWPGVLTALFPWALGDTIHAAELPGAPGAYPEMGLGSFGILGWSAALLVLRPGSGRSRAEWILAGLLLLGFSLAIGQWPAAELISSAPVLNRVFPPRFASWMALCGPVIAALELDRLFRDRRRPGGRVALALLSPLALAAAAGLVFLRFLPEYERVGAAVFQRCQLALCLATLAVAGALVALARRRRNAIAGLIVLCAAAGLYSWRQLYPSYSPDLLYPPTPLTEFLKAQKGPFRVVGADSILFPNLNVFAGVEDIRTHDPVERRDYVAFLDATCGYPPRDYFKRIQNPDAPALDFLNVRYVIAGGGASPPGARWRPVYSGPDGTVFENASVLERAFVPTQVRFVKTRIPVREPLLDANAAFGESFRDVSSNRDWRGVSWLLDDTGGQAPGGGAEISDYRESTNQVSFRARVSSGRAFVVLSLVQDGGWSARDGKSAAIRVLRANGPFMALALPEGSHEVHLRYSPPGFRPGIAVSAVTLLLIAAANAFGASRRAGASRSESRGR